MHATDATDVPRPAPRAPRAHLALAATAVLASTVVLTMSTLLATPAAAQDERSVFSREHVTHLADLSSVEFEAKPDISHDLLTLLFASAVEGGAGGLDVWMATRAAQRAPFGPAVNVAELNSEARDHTPTTNADGTLIVYSSSRDGGSGSDDAWTASRASAADPWGAPEVIAVLNSPKRDMGFSMTPDGLCLYFTSNRDTPGGELEGTFDLYMSTRPDTASPWAAPTPVAELNTPFDDKFPSVAGDNLTLYFASNRPGSTPDPVGLPSLDIWAAMRPDVHSPWSIVEPVSEVNTEHSEYLMSVADDHSELFFVSDRPGTFGSFDLFHTYAVRGMARYGAGTPGALGIPRLRPRGAAHLGDAAFAVEVTRLAPDVDGFLLLGPEVDGLPAPGGPLLVDPLPSIKKFQDGAAANPPPEVPRVVALPIPDDAALVGFTIGCQAVLLDPFGQGQVGLVTVAASPGLRKTVVP